MKYLFSNGLTLPNRAVCVARIEKHHERWRFGIQQVMQERNTLGGIVEVVALNLPPGLGSFVHWDSAGSSVGSGSVEHPGNERCRISAVPSRILEGWELRFRNSIFLHEDGDHLIRHTNRSGGMEGGVTTGEPLLIRAAMKPIATTLKSQRLVDLAAGKNTKTVYERSDFCPVPCAFRVCRSNGCFCSRRCLDREIRWGFD